MPISVSNNAITSYPHSIFDNNFPADNETGTRADVYPVSNDKARRVKCACTGDGNFARYRYVIAEFNARVTPNIGQRPEEEPLTDPVAPAPEKGFGVNEDVGSVQRSIQCPVQAISSTKEWLKKTRIWQSGSKERYGARLQQREKRRLCTPYL